MDKEEVDMTGLETKLENIGFYTLSNYRAMYASHLSTLWRCELLLTDKCNFNCPYCRGMREDLKVTLLFEEAKNVIDLWANEGLKNIRFSGGEPTLFPNLLRLIAYTKHKNIERIAISTNGSADIDFYKQLFIVGVNDFSISLDACCSLDGRETIGRSDGTWDKVVDNIKAISSFAYVTIGVVVTEETINKLSETVEFIASLGVSDIRIISSVQFNKTLSESNFINKQLLEKFPILKYRVNNTISNRNVRGIGINDSHRCGLCLDDMAVARNYHFPCIIYLREGGDPIGKIGQEMRRERLNWYLNHNTFNDEICQKNCLDVCIDYNNKFDETNMKFSKYEY